MAKRELPEGRKPMTDADIAALTRRLAGTAVDYKELYEAAKRDAEEAEAYAAELETNLAKAVEVLTELNTVAKRAIRLSQEHDSFRLYGMEPMWQATAQTTATLAELTGGKDEY